MDTLSRHKFWLACFAICLLSGFALTFTATYTWVDFFVMTPQHTMDELKEGKWKDVNIHQYQLVNEADFSEAHQVLNHHLNATEQDAPSAYFLLGELYTMQGDYMLAMTNYELALEHIDTGWYNPVAYQNLTNTIHSEMGIIEYLEGDLPAARRQFQHLDDWSNVRNPSLVDALWDVTIDETRADYQYRAGTLLAESLYLEEAEKALDKANTLSTDPVLKLKVRGFLTHNMPKYVRSMSPMIRYYCLSGDAQGEAANYRQAITFYEKAIKAKPDLEWSYHHLSQMYSHLQEYEKAVQYANKAAEINPDFLMPFVTLGDVALDQRDYTGAISHFNRALGLKNQPLTEKNTPILANLENQLGFAYEQIGDLTQALNHYREAMDLSDEDSQDYQYAEAAVERLHHHRQTLSSNS